MTELPLVSCLMTVYNHEAYVVEAIESALAQVRDYPADRLEIILVDDGSTDRTPEITAAYADRVRVIRKPNGGALSTVNRALQEARGELFCFLSGDDAWRPGKIARQAEVMAQRPWVSLVYGDCAIVDGASRVTEPSYYGLHGLPRPVGDVRGPLLEKNVICAPSVMMRTSLRERVWPIGPPAAWEDWWMYAHASHTGEAFYLPGADVVYRVHGANMSVGLDPLEQQRFIARELPYRRWLLTDTDHDGVPWEEVLSALQAFEWHVQTCAGAGLGAAQELVPVTAEHRSAAREEVAAVATAVPAEAVRRLVRALALDPGSLAARELLGGAVETARHAAPPPACRAVTVAALAGELARRPGLLAAHVEAFDEDDDVTLVVDARGWSVDRLERELIPVAAGLGLADGGPDVVIVDDGRPWPCERTRAVLTADAGTAEALGAPQAQDAVALREAVGQPSATATPNPVLP